MRSISTFSDELATVGNIPGVLYPDEREYTYPKEGRNGPFVAVERYEISGEETSFNPSQRGQKIDAESDLMPPLHETGWFFSKIDLADILDSKDDPEKIGDALIDALSEVSGIDWGSVLTDVLNERVKIYPGTGRATADLGSDALGSYLPWHIYGRSKKTPWGMYIFIEPHIDNAVRLFRQLPPPAQTNIKPSGMFLACFWATYRHELFHFQVEKYTLRQEVITATPMYRPYLEYVEPKVAGTKDWLEEALAQEICLKSKFLSSRMRKNWPIVQKIFKQDFLKYPPGYRDFECMHVGGRDKAICHLASQITQRTVNPAHQVTLLATPRLEYSSSRKKCPGYIMFHPDTRGRFQLSLPNQPKFESFLEAHPEIVFFKSGPGDHKTYEVCNHKVQVNYIKGNVDLASVKKVARALGSNVHKVTEMTRTKRYK